MPIGSSKFPLSSLVQPVRVRGTGRDVLAPMSARDGFNAMLRLGIQDKTPYVGQRRIKMKSIDRALAAVPDELWNDVRELSQPISCQLAKRRWINNKYYRRNFDNESGCVEQLDLEGQWEIQNIQAVWNQVQKIPVP